MISCIIFMDWGSWVLAEVCGNAFSSEVPRGGNTVEAGTAPVRWVRHGSWGNLLYSQACCEETGIKEPSDQTQPSLDILKARKPPYTHKSSLETREGLCSSVLSYIKYSIPTQPPRQPLPGTSCQQSDSQMPGSKLRRTFFRSAVAKCCLHC